MALFTHGGASSNSRHKATPYCTPRLQRSRNPRLQRSKQKIPTSTRKNGSARSPEPTESARSSGATYNASKSIAEQWFQLGLIDRSGKTNAPWHDLFFLQSRRGPRRSRGTRSRRTTHRRTRLRSRQPAAGHRFNAIAAAGRPLTHLCQQCFGSVNIPGYLRRGLPGGLRRRRQRGALQHRTP